MSETGLHPDGLVPVAVTERSGFVESVHHGAVVVLDTAGDVAFAAGDQSSAVYPRSANKPLQTDAMLRLGLTATPETVALACASHDGTERHVAVTRELLVAAGLDDAALGNTPGLPLDPDAAADLLRGGGGRDAIHMNCSGKHAAMLATCVARGWPTDGYLDVGHPLQVAITARVADLCGGVEHIGVDGCGAPAHVVRLRGLAAAFAAIAGERGEVWEAMTAHPDLVGGDRRDVTRLMRLVPELMAKDGAEGMFAAALPDGRAAAVKIGDGSSRPAGVVLAAALATVGVDVDPAALGEPIRGHGRPVGTVRPWEETFR